MTCRKAAKQKSKMGMEPTPSPTKALYSKTSLDVMMVIAFTSSIFLRSLIGAICLKRLFFYYQRGLMRCGEIKTVFHVAMFATLFFSLPYFIWCDYYYEDSFCYVSEKKAVTQFVYCLYSLGLVLQVIFVIKTNKPTVFFFSSFFSTFFFTTTFFPAFSKKSGILLIVDSSKLGRFFAWRQIHW
jgi:hypothetical protein